jgi:hypothetical protein
VVYSAGLLFRKQSQLYTILYIILPEGKRKVKLRKWIKCKADVKNWVNAGKCSENAKRKSR